MEIPVAAGPWLVLGAVLGVLLPALAGLAVVFLRGRRDPTAPSSEPSAPDPAHLVTDDLPGFLESPPGSAAAASPPPSGWPALSAPPAAASVSGDRSTSATTGALVAMALTGLLLIGAAAAVATAGTSDPTGAAPEDTRSPTTASGPALVSAELTFGGVVLERHVVGVTVAYPRVRVTVGSDRPAVEVELPTFNCLRAEAPEDPVAAGCTRSVTEYAQLSGPELTVRSEGEWLRFSGAFPAARRANGSPPVATGRVYELVVSVVPRDDEPGAGREPATGLLELGDERVGTSDRGPNTVTYAG